MLADLPALPRISVVMPVYNVEHYVADAIRSILAQSYPPFEFIIVDDGSTDGSAAIVGEYAARDPRIRPLLLAHGGVARALNAGVELAQGDLIARMDADDIALPARFATQLAWMRQTDVELCGSCVQAFGAGSGLLWFPETHAAIRHELLFRIGLLHPTVIVPAAILKAHRYHEQATHEDYELWTRLALHCRMGNVPQVLLQHRAHAQQVCQTRAAALGADIRRFRQPYFFALFPEATAEDYAALACAADRQACPDLASLERAGAWLIRLAQTPDQFLRAGMARRWLATCQRSAQLGPPVHTLYRRLAPEFGADAMLDEGRLWLACALRSAPGSRLRTGLARLRGRGR